MAKWQIVGDSSNSVASLMLSNIDEYSLAVENLFSSEPVPYSGIIISQQEALANGGKIEKSCYNKGGFKFLFRSYADTIVPDEEFPVRGLTALLEKVATMYARQVLSLNNKSAQLDSCWAVCQREGDYGTLHNHVSPHEHEGELYSGMLYLQAPPTINPDTFPDGCLHLITPDEVVYVPPIPGSIVFWPAHLVHGIHPFRGSGDRLGVAFNVVIG